jgi:hypothetical protein
MVVTTTVKRTDSTRDTLTAAIRSNASTLGVQILRDLEGLHIFVGERENWPSGHKTNAPIRRFVDQDGDLRTATRIGQMLDHLLHDQRIADHDPVDLGSFLATLVVQDLAKVETDEFHESGFPTTLLIMIYSAP